MQKFICFREGLGLGSLARARNEREDNKAQQFLQNCYETFETCPASAKHYPF